MLIGKSKVEYLTLVGIAITFLTTIFGWIFTYRTQLAILKAQSDYQYHKEQQKVLIDDKLAFVKDLQAWFENGRKIFLESSITPLEIQNMNAKDIDEEEGIARIRRIASRIEEAKHIVSEFRELRAAEPRLLYLAKIDDPLANESPRWEWGNSKTPYDLPQIIDNFENEVMDQVDEMLFGKTERTFPKVEEQFHSLHEAGIQATERMKVHIVFQNTTK